MAGGKVRAVVANSGCSNSLNGQGGYDDARLMTELAARASVSPEEFAVASTGVTGARCRWTRSGRHRPDRGDGRRRHDFALAIDH
jgi:N-acetylglutamate synthase/N-acetylornithine aminotransferase